MVALARSAIETTKNAANCQDIAQRYGLRKSGGTHGGWELHYRPGGEHKASFGIKPDGWHDFASGEHGDAISLVRMITGCTFLEAVATLGGSTYTPFTNVYPLTSSKPFNSQTKQVSESWQSAALGIVEQAERNLWSDSIDAQRVRAYLHDERELTDETIKHFRLGYLPDWTKTAYRKEDGKPARVAPGITIPTFINGKLEALKIRTRTGKFAAYLKIAPDTNKDGSESPKYTQMKGGNPSPLFGADDINNELPTFIYEGEFDAMVSWQDARDLANAVTVGSSSNANRLSEATRERLEATATIFAATDNDEAGNVAAKNLIELFPTAQRVTVPMGKDLTEFAVDHAGDVRQWISEVLAHAQSNSRVILAGLPDGVRSVALNCKLEAALIVCELARASKGATANRTFSAVELLEFAKRFNMGIAKHTMYRGLRDGTGVFFTSVAKSDTIDSSIEEDVLVLSDFATERYSLLPIEQIRIALRARLHYRLMERLFPSRRAELPPIEAELIKAAGHDNPTQAAEQIQAIVDGFTSDIERARVKHKIAFEQWALKRLEAMLTQRKITPTRWVAGVDFAAQFYRAVHEADPKPRSENEIGLIVGRGRQNLDGLLARAGVKSEQRQAEHIELTDPDKIEDTLTAVYQRAKGNGQISGVRSVDERGFGKPIPFEPETVKTWAASELAQGRTVEFSIKLCNEQTIAGEVQPRQKPVRVKILPTEGEIPPVEKQPHIRQATLCKAVYLGEGYSPDYARTTLIKIHARSWALSVDDPMYGDLTNDELIRTIIGEPEADDFQKTDVITQIDDPFIASLIRDHGGKVTIGEHPGKALLDAYNGLPSYLAQCDYFDGLMTAQRRDLLDYKHRLGKVA